jgi:glyoxylase-like metal-dependent hydrolase (beta-lactamase superfamily II)
MEVFSMPDQHSHTPQSSCTIHTIPGYICNLYLAEYPEGILLLDSGAANDAARIEEYCNDELNRPATDIKLTVVSHMHPDHGGGAVLLRKKHGIPIAAHPECDRWYRGITGIIQHRIDCYMTHFVARQARKPKQHLMYKRTLSPDFPLPDGGAIPFFPGWKAIHVPGHTLHDLALYNPEDRILYAADCIINAGGRYHLPNPVFFKGRMAQSMKKLSALDIETILVAHGEPIHPDNPAAVFEHMISLMDLPLNDAQRFYYNVGFFTPEFWRAYARKRMRGKHTKDQ